MKRIIQITLISTALLLAYWASFPLLAEIHLSLGNAYAEKGLPFIAIDHYESGISYGPTSYNLYHRLGSLCFEMVERGVKRGLSVTGVDKCIDIFKKGGNITGSPFLDDDLGKAYLLKGDRDMAISYFMRAHEKSEGKIGRR